MSRMVKLGLSSDQFGVAAQNLYPDGMEGAQPRHAFHRLADHRPDALFHFPRRLVGEGDGKNFRRAGAPEAENMGDAGGEHPCFAGAGTGEHQHRTVERLHGGALLRIEPGEIWRAGGRAGTRRDAAGRGRRSWGGVVHRVGQCCLPNCDVLAAGRELVVGATADSLIRLLRNMALAEHFCEVASTP